jgi:DNA invertase Pin-like site-specific DNA recombinase
MREQRFIGYYRVSTQRQGRSGLGLDAQQKAVKDHLCGRGKLVAQYTEIESGRLSDRPKLAEALAACRLHRATLVIAKLDRLARNVAFVSNLLEAGADFAQLSRVRHRPTVTPYRNPSLYKMLSPSKSGQYLM